MDTLL